MRGPVVRIAKKLVGAPRADGSRRERFEVYSNIPGQGRRRTYCETEKEAKAERDRILRSWYASEGVTVADQRLATQAVLELKGSENEHARNHDVLFAVRWFCRHYQGASSTRTLGEYAAHYLNLRKDMDPETVRQDKRYLEEFIRSYGEAVPSDIQPETLGEYLDSFDGSKWHRATYLRSFFNWLCGKSRRTVRLKNPPLRENPFDFIARPVRRATSTKQILTLEQCRQVLRNAEELGFGPWVAFLLLTGLRPGGEAVKFWRTEDPWSRIHLDKGILIVDSSIEKVRKRTREVRIYPSLKRWLESMNQGPMRIPSRRIMDRIKGFMPMEKDIFRHTWMSNLYVYAGADQCLIQGATSMDMVRAHYVRQISPAKARTFFERLGPVKCRVTRRSLNRNQTPKNQ